MSQKIILDTNFLLLPCKFKIGIFSEIERICLFRYQLCVLDKSLDELHNIISRQGGKAKAAARLAFKLIKAKDIRIIPTGEGNVDDLLLQHEGIVATTDKALRQKLRKQGRSVIGLRQKKYLFLKE